jgi:hypothetical protein
LCAAAKATWSYGRAQSSACPLHTSGPGGSAVIGSVSSAGRALTATATPTDEPVEFEQCEDDCHDADQHRENLHRFDRPADEPEPGDEEQHSSGDSAPGARRPARQPGDEPSDGTIHLHPWQPGGRDDGDHSAQQEDQCRLAEERPAERRPTPPTGPPLEVSGCLAPGPTVPPRAPEPAVRSPPP